MGFLLLVLCTATALFGQAAIDVPFVSLIQKGPLTGSGSTTCNVNFNIGRDQTGRDYYDRDSTIVYIACPRVPNKQLVKVSVTNFDVAPGDTLTIYEGCGITNTIVARTYAGGASAATALPSSWFQADCDSDDGCLTFVFTPNGDHNKGKGIDLVTSCTNRPSVIECPDNVTIPSTCGINHSNSVAAIYTIPKPTATCSYDPVIMPDIVTVNSTVTPFTLRARDSEEELVANGDYFDEDGLGTLNTGEKIFLVMGDYTFSYAYMPIPAGDPIMCSFNVRVDEIAPICNNQVNISLNSSTCYAIIDADMLIEGDGCWVGYKVNIMDGVDAGTDTMTYANVGKTISVEVATPSGNKCWGLILVEDKAPPTFTCRDTAIYCGIDLNPDISNLYPTDGKDCTDFTFEYIDGPASSYGCNTTRRGPNADTIGIQQRIWTAIDAGGARSDTCIQNIYRLRPHLTTENIEWPKDTVFYCVDNPDRSFPPSITGYPQVKIGEQLINIETTCLFGIEYKDTKFTTDCEGVVKIGRVWTIMDWCGSGDDGGFALFQSEPQVIKSLDTIAPVLIGEPRTLEHFSSHGACSAHVIFPAIQVTDACSPSTSYKVQGPLSTLYHTVGSTAPDTMWNVPFGTHDFVYIGEDDCGNQVRHTINMEIKDLISPVAIVDERSNVSLTNDDDQTWVYATSFDNGSHDNCGVTEILARRMPADPTSTLPFTESVGFTCNDLGDTIMVEVRVLDACGNIGENMTEVIIVDKSGVCNCGMTTSLEVSGLNSEGYLCGGDVATLTATGGNRYSWSALSGGSPININEITVSPTETTTYTVTITNSNNIECEVEESLTILVNPAISVSVAIDDSGGGDDNGDNGILCSDDVLALTTRITGGTPNYTYSWSNGDTDAILVEASPSDPSYSVVITDANGCTATDTIDVMITTTPAAIEEISGFSNNGSVCVGVEATISAFNATLHNQTNYTYSWSTGETTFSITPTVNVTTEYHVTVTDKTTNCMAADTIIVNTNPLPNAEIKVGGVVTADTIFCEGEMLELEACGGISYAWSTGANTETIMVENDGTYTATVTDANGCTAVTSIMVNGSDISADVQSNTTICPDEGIQLIPIPVNGLTYTWTADTNVTTFVSADTIVTPKANTRYYVTITDGTCEIIKSVEIQVYDKVIATFRIEDTEGNIPSDEDRTSIAPGEMRKIIITEPTNIRSVVWTALNCADCLSCLVEDDAGNPCVETIFTAPPLTADGATDLYAVAFRVTDSNGCESGEIESFVVTATGGNRPAPMATISGTISTEEGEMVERATINLTNYDMPAQVTGATGDYGFQEIPMNGNYTVSPEKDMNPLNGVSTYDLVLISKHILGITPLNSPYKMIAADINHSGTITAFDMVQLRQLILNINDGFANNTSWRFVDAAYEFNDPTNPFREAFPETYTITDLDTDMNWLDFIAVKIGDVNNSAVVNNLMTAESRTANRSLDFQTKQGLSEDGQYLIFDFTANNFEEIAGYQFALQFDPQVIAFDKIVPSQWVGNDNFGLADIARGQIATSWNQAEGIDIPTDEVLFSLVFQLNGEVTSDELLEIAYTDLQAEAYAADGELLNVQLMDAEIAPQVAAKSIQLFQNRPNPFTGKTTIGFALPEASEATLRIFDTAGRMIQVYDGYYEKGYNELIISSQELTEYGALYYQLATPTQVATMKMIHAQ